MATPQSQPATSLQVTRTIAAPRDRVYRAWTDAKQFALWFHPTTDYTTVVTHMDLREGGAYSLEMHHKGGNVHTLKGKYQQIKPPEKLVFTWRWQHLEAVPESLVTVEFHDRGSSTDISITHQNLVDTEVRAKHSEGWIGCLGQLQDYLA